MMKKTVIAASIFICLFAAGGARAVDERTSTALSDTEASGAEIIRKVDAKIKTNQVFLKAAEKAVQNAKNGEAASYLRKARGLYDEAAEHYGKKEYAFALEDVAESTRMAMYAITLSTSPENSIRDTIIEEELLITSEHEHQRKERLITKGTAEVEIFIKAAERLLRDNPDKDSSNKIDGAKKLLAKSKTAVAENRYDDALAAIDEAYAVATHSVKDVKQSQGEIITFPKASFPTDQENFAYELKKNDTYMFFAGQTLKENDKESMKLLEGAKTAREDALNAVQKNEFKKAVEKIKASTSLLIKAVKSARGKS